MKLKDKFNKLSWEEQLSFLESYFKRRAKDLVEEPIFVKKKAAAKKKGKMITFTQEQYALLEKLNLV